MGRTVVRALGASVGAVACAAAMAAPAGAATGTVSIGVPPDPVRLTPTPITFNGWVDDHVRLYARATFGEECATLPRYGTPMVAPEGVPVGPGPFSVQATYLLGTTPSQAMQELICVWVATDEFGPIAAASKAVVQMRRARGTVSISAPPVETDVPTTVTVSGSVDAQRRLDVVHAGYCTTDEESDGDGAAGEHSAAHDDLPRLTPPEGILVGPGPFSVRLPWTPTMRRSDGRAICAYIAPVGQLSSPEFGVSYAAEWELPRIEGASPADGASRQLLNPRFSWSSSGSRRQPLRDDEVELWRVEGERRIPLVRITTARWEALSDHARTYLDTEGESGPTGEIASVRGASFQLHDGLWPGTYEWSIARSDYQPLPVRTFTVEAKPLRRLQVRTRWVNPLGPLHPSSFALNAMAVPFVTYRREWRVAGGPWRADQWREWRYPGTHDRIDLSCRRPGGVVVWRLYARDALGTVRMQRGSFGNVPAADCAQLRRIVETNRRYQRACRSIGGRPERVGSGNNWRCITPPGTPPGRVPGF